MRKILVLAVLLVFLVSCTAENKKELTNVKLRLKWLHQAQFAGNYVAKEKGYYEEKGLNATILPFDFNNFPITQLQEKVVDFGITGADELVKAKYQEKADDVFAIAVIYKINPVCLYTLKGSGITTPMDLIGKTVGIERAPDGTELNIGILYNVMLNNLDINKSKINEITIGYDAIELLQGKTDVSSGYIINEPHQVIQEGHEVNVILVADYGANMYADVLITHRDTIENNPDLVKKFVSATLKGWEYSILNEEEAVEITMMYANESTKQHQQYMLRKSVPLIHTGDSKLGYMEKEGWENVVSIMRRSNIIDSYVEVSSLYTNKFIG